MMKSLILRLLFIIMNKGRQAIDFRPRLLEVSSSHFCLIQPQSIISILLVIVYGNAFWTICFHFHKEHLIKEIIMYCYLKSKSQFDNDRHKFLNDLAILYSNSSLLNIYIEILLFHVVNILYQCKCLQPDSAICPFFECHIWNCVGKKKVLYCLYSKWISIVRFQMLLIVKDVRQGRKTFISYD